MRHEQEEKVTIEFIKDHPWGTKGSVKEVNSGYAKMMTESGYTKIIEPRGSAKRIKASKISNKSLSAAG